MREPREWPFEKSAKGSLRPWFLSTRGFIAVLFGDADEAERAVGGLRERGVSEEDMRLYSANQILDTLSSMQEDRSVLAAALVAFTDDRRARQLYRDNALAGGSALWLFAPTEARANHLIQLLADYQYSHARYFAEDGIHDLTN
jgi:hypothetical protein